ncbi:hypothetical protein NCU09604 [Neurospora crassa OR74A]|uniref:Uncharacterized protein n=1 Tax=Neurospora crassa (strain ATCC 24698 / 74-OR23-1A / CBS 708.71 / DSM 1257 / FGSC 987) TaxID=367110 RepID=Q7SC81_NEUCR|nr:hypothetical protein NCU09604 [Neurospora crassa OR74A]EAA34132.3 hypothetical protein NCU09604 [Neurospora crassa OR74A]|eukprot:XP_963368.3 hypothetical protein NCU09604 [Neurospora crassa OR74A]
MAPRRHQLSQPRKATKAGKKRRQKHKTALKKLLAETKETLQKKIEASDRQMNTTSAEILVLKRKLGEQRRAHEELVKKHETAETEAELMARLASVEHDDDDDGPKAAAAASKHKKRRDNKRFRFGQFNRLYRRRDRQQENDVQVRNSTSAPAIEVE